MDDVRLQKQKFLIKHLQKMAIKIPAGAPNFTEQLVCEAWLEEIDDLNKSQFETACSKAVQECRFFPSVSEFRSFAKPKEATSQENAVEVADRIAGAISAHGYTNPQIARQAIGELGWLLVERLGGWREVCHSIQSYDQLATFKAQWRNSLISMQNKLNRGDIYPPALPERRSNGLQSAASILKLL